MFRCPHCKESGVSVAGKLFAAPWAPTACSLCGGRSSEEMLATQILGGIHGVAPIPVALIALNYRSWLPVIIYLGLASLAHGLILFYAPLYPLSDQEIGTRRAGRRKTLVLLVIGVALPATIAWFLEP